MRNHKGDVGIVMIIGMQLSCLVAMTTLERIRRDAPRRLVYRESNREPVASAARDNDASDWYLRNVACSMSSSA